MRPLLCLVSLVLAGCLANLSGSTAGVEGDDGPGDDAPGDIDTDECKIEGSQIGQEGYVMRLGAKTITFQDWVTKPGEPNEYMGFTLALTGTDSIGYIVKAGGERYPSTSLTWSHPLGLQANAISNVDVCEECTDGSCDGGDGGAGDGGDGCIEGCDDGSGSGSDGPLT